MAQMDRAPEGGCYGINGGFYEGGQFLPAHIEVGLRPSQRQLDAELARAERLATDRRNSAHVGAVGQRIKAKLTIAIVMASNGFYGLSHFTVARDEAGRVFVSRGTWWGNQGDTISVVGTVKDHSDRDGVAQTVIKNVKAAKPT